MYLRRRVSSRELQSILVGIFVGGMGTAALVSNGHNPLDILLVGAMFYPAMFLGVCLHELGHAWGGLSVGGKVHLIELGRRYPQWRPWRVQILGVTWLINSAPTMGLTYVSFSTAKDFRTRQCWMIACGPSMNLALLGVGLLVPFFCDTSLLPYATGWCLAQVYLCLLSIIPHMAKFPDKPRPNDGLLFWQTLRLADVEVERYVLAGRVSLQFCESEALARSLTIEELNGRHEAEPANLPILWHLAHRLADLNDPRCGLYFGKLVAHPDLPEAYLSEAIDFVITQRLGIGPPENFEEADRLSQQLLALSNSISTRGTRGSVLVDIGRIEEGKALLQDVLAKTDSTIDKVYSNVFLALAEKQLGNLELALGYARAAAKVDTHCPALTRVADLLDPQAKRPAQVAASTI
jgi:hypothetical protein